MRIFNLFCVAVIGLLFSSCIAHDPSMNPALLGVVKRSYTALSADPVKPPLIKKAVALYFDGEQISAPYTKLGIVEVRSGNASKAELLDHLKYEGYRHGADAIAFIKDAYTVADGGHFNSGTQVYINSTKIVSGIAIKLSDEPSFNILPADRAYFKTVAMAKEREKSNNAGAMAGVFILTVLLCTALAIGAMGK